MISATMVTLAERMSHDELVRLGRLATREAAGRGARRLAGLRAVRRRRGGARHLGAGGGRDGAGTAAAAAWVRCAHGL